MKTQLCTLKGPIFMCIRSSHKACTRIKFLTIFLKQFENMFFLYYNVFILLKILHDLIANKALSNEQLM